LSIRLFRAIGINPAEKPKVRSSILNPAITILFKKENSRRCRVAKMGKGNSRLTVVDFVISVLERHEKQLDKSINRLERLAKKLENNKKGSKLGVVH